MILFLQETAEQKICFYDESSEEGPMQQKHLYIAYEQATLALPHLSK